MSPPISHEKTRPNKGVVLYDGYCAFCQKVIQILKQLDWLKQLEYVSFRDTEKIPANQAQLDPMRMEEEMHLLTPSREKAYAGYRAFRWIAGRIPLLWLIWPLLFIPGATALGNKTYLWIAKNRFKLVPCKDGVCTIPPKGK